jgi:hypothetical protein
MFEQTHTADELPSSTRSNATTKAELLSRAKVAIEDGERSLRDAAEALALAHKDFDATQREIAAAVGKSAAWVNRLLQWQKEGCPGTPFGPGSKTSRARRKRVQATKQEASRKAHTDDTEASVEKRKAEPEIETSTATSPLAKFKSAVDDLFPKMNYSAKCEAISYALSKGKVRVS